MLGSAIYMTTGKPIGKTAPDIIEPGGAETIHITFDIRDLACYDEEKAAWVMEPGDIQRSAARVLTVLMNGAPMKLGERNRNEAKK